MHQAYLNERVRKINKNRFIVSAIRSLVIYPCNLRPVSHQAALNQVKTINFCLRNRFGYQR